MSGSSASAPDLTVGGPSLPRLATGDPLRALAALGVLLLHVAAYAGYVAARADPAPAATAMERFGIIGHLFVGAGNGLGVFFVLSGFLLSRPFIAAWWVGRSRPSVRRYARHRVLRILPAYYAVLLVVALVFGTGQTGAWGRLLFLGLGQGMEADTPFMAPLGQTWSLGAEMLFYVAVGLVALACVARRPRAPRTRGRVLVAGSLLALAGATFAGAVLRTRAVQHEPLAAFYPWNSLYAFLPGVALAVVEQAVGTRRWRGGPARRAAAALAVAGGALAIATPSLHFWPATTLTGAWLVPVTGATLLLGGLVLAEWSGPPWRVLDNRPLHWLGVRSYGIYLVHYPICIWLMQHLDQERWWRSLAIMLPVTLVGSIVLADILHRVVERPALLFRDGRPVRGGAAAGATAGLAKGSAPEPATVVASDVAAPHP